MVFMVASPNLVIELGLVLWLLPMTTTSRITVGQIHCTSCGEAIRAGLGTVEGVRTVRPDAATDTVTVTYDETALGEDAIRARLSHIGYDPFD